MRRLYIYFLSVLLMLTTLSGAAAANDTSHSAIRAIPLYRLADTYDWTHSYTTNEEEKNSLIANNPDKSVVDDGIIGYVSPMPLPFTKPLYKMVLVLDNYLAPNDESRDWVIAKYGYQYRGNLGHIVPITDENHGDTKMLQWYRGRAKDSYSDADHYYQQYATYINNYSYEGPQFRLWSNPVVLQEINILSPNGGESLKGGSTVRIKWSSLLQGGTISLFYSTNGPSGPWKAIKMGIANTEYYDWTVPDTPSSNVVIEAQWRYDDNAGIGYCFDQTDAKFSITGSGVLINPGLKINPVIHNIFPAAPTNLTTSYMLLQKNITLYWKDNSSNETGFKIERKTEGGQFAEIATAPAGSTHYTDTGAQPQTQYYYRVKATGSVVDSGYSNEVGGIFYSISMPEIDFPELSGPTDLQAVGVTGSAEDVRLTWQPLAGQIKGYKIERKTGTDGSWEEIADIGGSKSTYVDKGLSQGTYWYRVRSYDVVFVSKPSGEASINISAPEEVKPEKVVMSFTVGQAEYNANGELVTMETSPVIQSESGRTFIPIRYVTQPIGATIDWDGTQRKVSVVLGTKKIELWIDNNMAQINGSKRQIDLENPAVRPLIINGRTMMPLRFISENLGCEVKWNPDTSSITISYLR